MVANRKVSGTAKSMPAGIGIGAGISLLITLAGALSAAWLISKEIIKEDSIGYCSIVILLAASMAGSFIAQALIKHQRLIVCAVTSGVYYIFLLAITALFFGGQYQGMGVTGLIVACGCCVIILLGLKRGEGHNKINKKFRYG